MTHPKTPAATSQPTPQQLNKITTQLRDLNKAYKAAVAANDKTQCSGASTTKPGE